MVVYWLYLIAIKCMIQPTILSGWVHLLMGIRWFDDRYDPVQLHPKGHRMDIKEFIQQVKPRAKRSQLDPFKSQIFELRELGYANGQIRDWLATNGIEVTQESVRKFLMTRERADVRPGNTSRAIGARRGDQETSHGLMASPAMTAGDADTDEPGAVTAGLSPKQRREMRADEFIKSENTLLNKIVKKKDP